MSTKWYIIILLGLGLLTHFLFFGHPNQTVFDEVHFGKFISGYYTNEYFFDIHPPLGKMAIAGFAKLFNFEPGFAFAEIGNQYPDKQYMILRFLPNLIGSLLPIVIFLLLLEMGINQKTSFFGGLFIIFENALLTQSRYILLDSFLLLFGFMALLFYFRYRNYPLFDTRYLILFGFFSGLTISVKWTGLSFLALPLAIETLGIFRRKDFKNVLKNLILPVAIAFGVYFIFFAGHLMVLNKSGPGDAFMSSEFQKTLIGNQNEGNENLQSPNIFKKFTELNLQMYQANQRLSATHPYSSQWYSWPLMTRPIYYWVNGDARIYLLGNPIIWWVSTLVLLLSIPYYILRIIGKYPLDKMYTFLLSGYILNLLPFIGVKRVMFLYHYFTAYIFAIMILIYLIDKVKDNQKILICLIATSAVAFIYFAPLNYGLDLSPKAYGARLWLESWR